MKRVVGSGNSKSRSCGKIRLSLNFKSNEWIHIEEEQILLHVPREIRTLPSNVPHAKMIHCIVKQSRVIFHEFLCEMKL